MSQKPGSLRINEPVMPSTPPCSPWVRGRYASADSGNAAARRGHAAACQRGAAAPSSAPEAQGSRDLAGRQGVDPADLAGGEREAEQVDVGGDPVWVRRLRDDGNAVLDVPAEHHLG